MGAAHLFVNSHTQNTLMNVWRLTSESTRTVLPGSVDYQDNGDFTIVAVAMCVQPCSEDKGACALSSVWVYLHRCGHVWVYTDVCVHRGSGYVPVCSASVCRVISSEKNAGATSTMSLFLFIHHLGLVLTRIHLVLYLTAAIIHSALLFGSFILISGGNKFSLHSVWVDSFIFQVKD